MSKNKLIKPILMLILWIIILIGGSFLFNSFIDFSGKGSPVSDLRCYSDDVCYNDSWYYALIIYIFYSIIFGEIILTSIMTYLIYKKYLEDTDDIVYSKLAGFLLGLCSVLWIKILTDIKILIYVVIIILCILLLPIICVIFFKLIKIAFSKLFNINGVYINWLKKK